MTRGHKKSQFNRVRQLYSSEAGRWIMALVVSLLMVTAVYCAVKPCFMTIDDARLKYVFAGYSSGTPVESYLFSYFPLSFILSKLYTWMPEFHWYGFYQFGVIGLASALIGKTIYKVAYRKGIRPCWAVLLHVWVYLTAALISTILMHFEITAAMAGTAGVILLLGLDVEKDPLFCKITDFVFSILGIAASLVIQFNAFYAACCYLVVVLVFLLLKGNQDKKLKKSCYHFICYFLCLVVVVMGVLRLENNAKNTQEWQEYLAYNKYRVSFWDYPHISYKDNPALFEEMGWTESFYNMTQSMYFMDERFNQENLAKFTQRFSWFNFESLDQMTSTLYQTMKALFQSERLAVLQTGIMIAFTLLLLSLLCNKKWRLQYYPQILSSLCCVGGTYIIMLFLGAKGRLPLRALLASTIPCICVVTLLLLMIVPVNQRNTGKKAIRRVFVTVLAATWLLGMIWTYDKVINTDRAWRVDFTDGVLLMEEYVCNNPDKVFVYDHMGAQNYSVFSHYPDENYRPTNAFGWGSSYLHTPVYQEQLRINGLQSLTTKDLFQDNVYFIGHTARDFKNQLRAMLWEEYGPVLMRPVAEIGNIFKVYQFSKIQG